MNEFVVAIALFATAPPHHQQSDVYMPWRMGNWITCQDGTNGYVKNPEQMLEPFGEIAQAVCARHGGLRAYGPGRRMNEK